MPVHLHSLVRSGVVSPRAYRRMMADHASKVDDGLPPRGALGDDQINDPQQQNAGARSDSLGLPSRGGQTRGGAPHVGANSINKKTNKKKFPPGATLRGKGNKLGPVPGEPWKSHPVQPGQFYGGGGRRG